MAGPTTDSTAIPVMVQPSILRTPSVIMNTAAHSKPRTESREFIVTPPPLEPTPPKDQITKSVDSMCDKATPSISVAVPVPQNPHASGSSRNPIILMEAPREEESGRKNSKSGPHEFQDRHSKLYTYKAPRTALTPKPANGSTFTGHTGQDMYRVRKAKMSSSVQQVASSQHFRSDVPFQIQYPLSVQYLGHQQKAEPPIQYFALPPPRHSVYMHRRLNEQQPRMVALQHNPGHVRSTSHKRHIKMPEDVQESSESTTEVADHDDRTTLHKPIFLYPLSVNSEEKSQPITTTSGADSQLASLTELASLLTSLLRKYPQSADAKQSRDEIALLASMQNRHLAEWLEFEARQTRISPSPYTPRLAGRAGSTSPKPHARNLRPSAVTVTEVEMEKKRKEKKKGKRDDEVRGLLSADAVHWQDGSGLGVSDVFCGDGGGMFV